MTKEDITGQKFNKLTVIKIVKKNNGYYGRFGWFLCDCGKRKFIEIKNVVRGRTKSCGCINIRGYSHGLSNHRLCGIWRGMKARCLNSNNPSYKHYGGRGITICDDWIDDLKKFYDWAINNGYQDNLSIDRIDNDGNYAPDNCRWATAKIQASNKRRKPIMPEYCI